MLVGQKRARLVQVCLSLMIGPVQKGYLYSCVRLASVWSSVLPVQVERFLLALASDGYSLQNKITGLF